MEIPQDLHYTREHEWIRIEGDVGWIGITDFAQSQLGDIVLVELPPAGSDLAKGDSFGVVESVKTVSDLYAPVSGKILESNDLLLESPEVVNEDPYGEGWIAKIKISNTTDLKDLLDAKAYQAYIEEEQA